MRKKGFRIFAVLLLILFGTTSCSDKNTGTQDDAAARPLAQIYLYGEEHGIDSVIQKEFEIWYEHYHEDGMRHLFLESPFFTCEFLNIWMREESDEILDALYDDLEGTAAHVPAKKDFYKQIKTKCPETVFHGTDVGHQFYSTGERFLEYLEQRNSEDTEQYRMAREVMEQGKYYYENADDVYREHKMTENFMHAFDALDGETVMGIYGAAHVHPDQMDYTGQVPCMANQLKTHYGDIIYSEDLFGK